MLFAGYFKKHRIILLQDERELKFCGMLIDQPIVTNTLRHTVITGIF